MGRLGLPEELWPARRLIPASGNKWTITSGGQVAISSTADATTSATDDPLIDRAGNASVSLAGDAAAATVPIDGGADIEATPDHHSKRSNPPPAPRITP